MTDLIRGPSANKVAGATQMKDQAKDPSAESTHQLDVQGLISGVLRTLMNTSMTLAKSRMHGQASLESDDIMTLVNDIVSQMYPSLVKKFVEVLNSLGHRIAGLEDKLLDAAESIKRRNRELLVVKEYHKVLLKKYRLLVTEEEFKDHLNGYDKRLKLDVSTDDPMVAAKKYEREKQENGNNVMKYYDATSNVAIKNPNEQNKSATVQKVEQEKKERNEPVKPKPTSAAELKGVGKSKSVEPGEGSKPAVSKLQKQSPAGPATQTSQPSGPAAAQIREVFAVPEPVRKVSPPRVKQNPATPVQTTGRDNSGNHSEFYTIDLEQSSFRTGGDEDGVETVTRVCVGVIILKWWKTVGQRASGRREDSATSRGWLGRYSAATTRTSQS